MTSGASPSLDLGPHCGKKPSRGISLLLSFGLLGTGADPTYSGHCVRFVGSPAACPFGGDFISLFRLMAAAPLFATSLWFFALLFAGPTGLVTYPRTGRGLFFPPGGRRRSASPRAFRLSALYYALPVREDAVIFLDGRDSTRVQSPKT
jgi:hypothetical protein